MLLLQGGKGGTLLSLQVLHYRNLPYTSPRLPSRSLPFTTPPLVFFFFYKKGGLILIHPPINFPPTLPSQPGVFVFLIFFCLSSCGGPRAVLVVGCGETRLSWELPWTARSHRQAVSWQEVHMQIYTRLPVLPPVCLAPGNTCKLNSVHC